VNIGSFVVVSSFCIFLTLFEFGVLGSDKNVISQGFFVTIMCTTSFFISAMLLGVMNSAREIYLSKDDGLPSIMELV
jgi:hypothetical protein